MGASNDGRQEMEIIEKPWGREKILELNDKYCLKILEVDAGKSLSLQFHKLKKETMYCIYGFGELLAYKIDGEKRSICMMPGRFFTIEPGVIHRLIAGKNSVLSVIEASSPEVSDIVRIEDDYGRVEP